MLLEGRTTTYQLSKRHVLDFVEFPFQTFPTFSRSLALAFYFGSSERKEKWSFSSRRQNRLKKTEATCYRHLLVQKYRDSRLVESKNIIEKLSEERWCNCWFKTEKK